MKDTEYTRSVNKNTILLLIIAGFAIRALFMPITIHGDLIWINLWPSKLSFFNIFDGFDYIIKNYREYIKQLGVFYYGPLTYLFFAGIQFIYKIFVPNLGEWLKTIETTQMSLEFFKNPIPVLDYNYTSHIFKYLFFMKLPYLIFDIGILSILFKLFPLKKINSVILWAFNPVLLYGTYLFGQFDIIIGFIILLAVYFASNNKKYLAIITLSAGVCFKTVPIFLILPTIIILGNNWKEYLKLIFISIIAILIPIAIFYVHSNAVIYSIFPGVLKDKVIGSNEIETAKLLKLCLLGIGYSFFLYSCFNIKNKQDKQNYLPKIYLCIFLLMYSLLSTSIHYFIWIIPVFILISLEDKRYTKFIWILSIAIMIYKIKKSSMCLGLFAPLNPEYFYSLPDLNELLSNSLIKWKNLVKIFRILFISTSFYTIYTLCISNLKAKTKSITIDRA
ncbi:hypothetical protein KKC59_01650 [bacterium]|nr:hypothetical protein [bacterium]